MHGLKRDPRSTVPLVLAELGVAREHRVEPPGAIILHDPIEDDPDLQPILEAAQQAAERDAAPILAQYPDETGNCHLLWTLQQRILKEQYNIDWKTPAETNPHLRFD